MRGNNDDERSMHLSISEMFSKPLENYFVNTTHKSVEKLFLWRNRDKMKFTSKKRPRWSWKFVISVLGGLNLDSQWNFIWTWKYFQLEDGLTKSFILHRTYRAPLELPAVENQTKGLLLWQANQILSAIQFVFVERENICKLCGTENQLASCRLSPTASVRPQLVRVQHSKMFI